MIYIPRLMNSLQTILFIGFLTILGSCGNKSNRTDDPLTPESLRFSFEKITSEDLAKNIDPALHYVYTVRGRNSFDFALAEQTVTCQFLEWQEDITLDHAFYERYRTNSQMRFTKLAEDAPNECKKELPPLPATSKMTNLTVLRKYYKDSQDFFKNEKKICQMLKEQANIICTKVNKFELSPTPIAVSGRSAYAIQLQFDIDGTVETEDEDGHAKLNSVQIIGHSISNSFAPYAGRPYKLYLKIKQMDSGVEAVISDSQLVAITRTVPHEIPETSLSFERSNEQMSENQKILNDLGFYLHPNPGYKPLVLSVTTANSEVIGIEISEVVSLHKKITADDGQSTECLFSEQYDYLSKIKNSEGEALLLRPVKAVASSVSRLKSACLKAIEERQNALLKSGERPLSFSFDKKTKKGQLGPLEFQILN